MISSDALRSSPSGATVENIPDSLLESPRPQPDIFVHDLKMTREVIRDKVQLSQHMFSFLRRGRKQVHFPNAAVDVNERQSLLIRSGNCIWSELLDDDDVYYCKLLFFSDRMLQGFLDKSGITKNEALTAPPCFIIENDAYLHAYLDSLSRLSGGTVAVRERLLSVKFEELLVYLLGKYGPVFGNYLHTLVARETSAFRTVVENNVRSNLSLEDIAFLCHMSLSTFKRTFVREFGISPGKWFRDQRLERARAILAEGKLTSSDIYLQFGYNNLSNFSAAFKNKFGKRPTEISQGDLFS